MTSNDVNYAINQAQYSLIDSLRVSRVYADRHKRERWIKRLIKRQERALAALRDDAATGDGGEE